jgi:hypothetical protein
LARRMVRENRLNKILQLSGDYGKKTNPNQ